MARIVSGWGRGQNQKCRVPGAHSPSAVKPIQGRGAFERGGPFGVCLLRRPFLLITEDR